MSEKILLTKMKAIIEVDEITNEKYWLVNSGSREGEEYQEEVGMLALHFPEGTKLIVKIPVCKVCHEEICDC